MIVSKLQTLHSKENSRNRTHRPAMLRRFQVGLVGLVTAAALLVAFPGTASAAVPVFTSATSTNFGVGSNGTFTVSASGTTPITFTETGSLPSGVSFVSNGGSTGTATLSGTPASGTSGVYPITITAANGTSPNATQNFTLNVWSSAPTCNAWDSIQAPSGSLTASFTISGAGGGGGGFGGSGTPGAGADGAQVNATYTVSGGQTLWVNIGCGGGGGADGTGTHTALSGGGSAGTGYVAGGVGGGWYTNGLTFYAGAGGGGGASTVACLQPTSGGSSNCGSGDTELSIAAGGGGGGGTTCTDNAGGGGGETGTGSGNQNGSGYASESGAAGGNEQSGGNGTTGGGGGTASAGAGGTHGSNNSTAGNGGAGGGSPTGTGGSGGQQANSASRNYGTGGGGGGGGWTGGGGGGANSCGSSAGGSGGGGAGASWATTSTGGTGISFVSQSGTSTSCGQTTGVGTSLAGGLGGAASAANGANAYAGCAGNIALTWTLKTSPTLTAAGPATASIGTAIAATSISATLASGSSPTGTITFSVFGPGSEPSTCTSGGSTVGTATVTGNTTYHPSGGYTPSAAGDYWWYASYGGDGNNNAAASACGSGMSETVVAAASPTLSVAAPASGNVGTAIPASSITATLSGSSGSNDTNTITYMVFGPQSSVPTSCTSGGTTVGTATPAGDGTYSSSASFTPTHTGDYWWYTSSPSDANNNAAASACPPAVETVVSVLVHNGATLSDGATDAGAGVASVTYYYCPSPNFTTLTCTSSTPWTFIGASSSTSPYSVAWTGQPTNGDYVVVAIGTDNVLNADTTPSTSIPVTVSNIAPSVAVTYPVTGTSYGANWSGTITGTATSNDGSGSSISSAAVQIEDTTTSQYWNGSSWQSGSVYNAASVASSWTYAFSSANLTSGHNYAVTSQATDNFGNTGTSTAVSFTYKGTAPTVATMIGQASGASVIGFVKKNTGYYVYANVTDNSGTGIQSVTANVSTVTSGDTAVPLIAGSYTAPGGGSYNYRSALLTSNASQSDGAVSYTVNAEDNLNNISTYSNNGSVTFDSTVPTGSVSVPAYSSSTSVSVTFSATDNTGGSGVDTAGGELMRASASLSNGTCGSSYSSYSQVGSTGLSSPYSDTVSSGNCYKYEYMVSDNVGNLATIGPSGIVEVDTGSPTFAITKSGSNVYTDGSAHVWVKSGTTGSSFTLTATESVSGINASTVNFPTITGWTEGTVTTTATTASVTYTETASPGTGAQSASVASNTGSTTTLSYTISSDTSAPANNLSLSSQSGGGSYLSGNTVYYQGSSAGSFTITNNLTDSGSGPASSSFPVLGGATTGWTHTANTDTSSPYVSNTFSWTGGTTSGPTEIVTGTDNVGNSTATTLTFVNDSTAPSGGAVSVNSTAASAVGSTSSTTSTTFAINSRTNYTDASSGLASSTLIVQSETFTNNSCGAPGSGGPFTSPTTITGTTQPSGILAGYCYLYTLTGTDNVGNTASISTTVQVFGSPSQLVFTQQPSGGLAATAWSTQPKVSIEDSNGNVITTDTSAVTLAIGTNPNSGTLSGCTETTTAGVASFSACQINKSGNGYTLTAKDSTDGLNTASAPSSAFNIYFQYSGSSSSAFSTTSTRYYGINSSTGGSTSSTGNAITPGVAETLTSFTFTLTTTSTAAWTATIQLITSGSPSGTALTCAVAAGQTSCTVTANVSVSATQSLNVQVSRSGSDSTPPSGSWTTDYTQP